MMSEQIVISYAREKQDHSVFIRNEIVKASPFCVQVPIALAQNEVRTISPTDEVHIDTAMLFQGEDGKSHALPPLLAEPTDAASATSLTTHWLEKLNADGSNAEQILETIQHYFLDVISLAGGYAEGKRITVTNKDYQSAERGGYHPQVTVEYPDLFGGRFVVSFKPDRSLAHPIGNQPTNEQVIDKQPLRLGTLLSTDLNKLASYGVLPPGHSVWYTDGQFYTTPYEIYDEAKKIEGLELLLLRSLVGAMVYMNPLFTLRNVAFGKERKQYSYEDKSEILESQSAGYLSNGIKLIEAIDSINGSLLKTVQEVVATLMVQSFPQVLSSAQPSVITSSIPIPEDPLTTFGKEHFALSTLS